MHVLVSGAGIAGPTLAWFLAKAGHSITIVERSDAIRPYGQSIEMQGSAITAFRKTGLWEKIRERNTTEKGTQFIGPDGRTFAPLPLREGLQASFTSAFEILRGDLAAVLYEATKEHPKVVYKFATTVARVIRNGDDCVEVELSDGSIHTFDLLVAADGQWSKIRKQCFDPDDVAMIHKGMYGAYWTIPRIASDNDWWNICISLGGKIMALRPDPYGTIRVYLSCVPRGETQKQRWQDVSKSDRQTQEDLLKKEFADAGWQAKRFLANMSAAPDFYFQVIEQVRMKKWSTSRVICLGDAAYAPTPLTGSGTSLAVLGAYVLAGEISELEDTEHPRRALDEYERKFRPFVEETQKIPSVLPGFTHPKTAWQRWLLSSALSFVSWLIAMPWMTKYLRSEESEDKQFPLPVYTCFEEIEEK